MLRVKGRPLRLLIDAKDIEGRVRDIARDVEEYFEDEEIIVICLLKGAFIFASDLVRNIKRRVKVDFLWVSSYGSSMESSGIIKIIKDIDIDIKGKSVLLVDDVLDTGNTFREIVEFIRKKEPRKFATCVAVRKEKEENRDIRVDFVGFTVPDVFLVGYGMDWDEEGKHLPGIYAVE